MEVWDILDENGNITGETICVKVIRKYGKKVYITKELMHG